VYQNYDYFCSHSSKNRKFYKIKNQVAKDAT